MVRGVVLATFVLLMAACAPRVATTEADGVPATTTAAVGEVTAVVVMPSLERCLHAGRGATIAFGGDRLGWTCESPVDAPRGLFGPPVVSGGVDVTWRLIATERGDDGALAIAKEERVDARAVRLMLATDETCLFAGTGATRAFDGERVNFTCPDEVVVVGDLIADADGLIAIRGTMERDGDVLRLVDPRPVRVTSVTLE